MTGCAYNIDTVRQIKRYNACRLSAIGYKTYIVLPAKLRNSGKRSHSAVYVTPCGHNDHGSITADLLFHSRQQFIVTAAAVGYAVIYLFLFIQSVKRPYYRIMFKVGRYHMAMPLCVANALERKIYCMGTVERENRVFGFTAEKFRTFLPCVKHLP